MRIGLESKPPFRQDSSTRVYSQAPRTQHMLRTGSSAHPRACAPDSQPVPVQRKHTLSASTQSDTMHAPSAALSSSRREDVTTIGEESYAGQVRSQLWSHLQSPRSSTSVLCLQVLQHLSTRHWQHLCTRKPPGSATDLSTCTSICRVQLMDLGPTTHTGSAAVGARPQPSSDRPERRRSTDATFAAAEPGVAAAALPFCQTHCSQRRCLGSGLHWTSWRPQDGHKGTASRAPQIAVHIATRSASKWSGSPRCLRPPATSSPRLWETCTLAGLSASHERPGALFADMAHRLCARL